MRSTLPAFDEIWQRQSWAGILRQIQAFPEQTSFLIGCSGGMDSMLLLHLMHFLCPEKIRVIYIDHQLQALGADWGQFVSEECQKLHVPCAIERVNVAVGNLENQAREARYQAFRTHLLPGDILLLAHHQQDQAETLLLRLFSGSGVQGLTAMKQLDVREDLSIWRPLLDLSREQICQWADQLNVQNIEDPTNTDTYYDRAWCREELWPLLSARFPKMQQAISRTTYLMQDADEILSEVLNCDLETCGDAEQLSLEKLAVLSKARQRQLLSAWMKGQEQYRPSFDMVERLGREVIESKGDAQAALHWNGFYYVRFQSMLYRLKHQVYLAAQTEKNLPDQTVSFELNEKIQVLSGVFQAEKEEVGLSYDLLKRPLCLHQRQGGEKIHLYGRVGRRPLKKAIQDAQIFPWLRHTIQILSVDNVMLGVFTPTGFWLAQSPYCESGGWQPSLLSQNKELNNRRES